MNTISSFIKHQLKERINRSNLPYLELVKELESIRDYVNELIEDLINELKR
jgi:hypothetical protein